LEVVFELPIGPAGLTVTGKGAFLLSLDQEEKPQFRVVEVAKSGESKPFPTPQISQADPTEPIRLDSVRGLDVDAQGTVWMLDNGRRSELPPKLIGWDYEHKRLARYIQFGPPAVVASSDFEDLCIDPQHPFIYLADPANGEESALIVLDLTTGLARRVLQGHPSVVAVQGLDLMIDGEKLETKRLDGTVAHPLGGVLPLALDKKGEWLYFGPLRSTRLYRVRTEHLRNASLSPDKLAGLVEEYSEKPICAGISLDTKGNIYVSDICRKAIGVIAAGTKEYRMLVTDGRFQWPDGLCFGADGRLYFYTNARRAMSPAARRANVAPQMNYLFRIQTPASGRVGE
jgi:sugar lactone lactonase YvrE